MEEECTIVLYILVIVAFKVVENRCCMGLEIRKTVLYGI